ncbi:MAG: hypothetical protein V4717_15590 [Bacteroidota bacterium]
MKVLFLHANNPDYLSASLFHGLRLVLGDNCIDLPRFDWMYRPFPDLLKHQIRGYGFTLFGLIPDDPVSNNDRFKVCQDHIHEFDYYIIADIWRQWDDYSRLCRLVARDRIVVIDPADKPRVFPWNNLVKEHRYFRRSLAFLFKPVKYYYKREMVGTREALAALPALFDSFAKSLLPTKISPISFSIPEEKILRTDACERSQLFASNIVDEEVSEKTAGSFYTPLGEQQYAFDSEQAYYADIQQSRFGITTKRSGWDCLRHYEIAANGAVICFKHLDKKPVGCAPHGLDRTNCIIYDDYSDLMQQINCLSNDAYLQLKTNTRIWINNYTTTAVAQRFLDSLATS